MSDIQEPTIDKYGSEVHPAFGMVQANRVSSTGTHLFDSDVKHQHFVTLKISGANRKRDLHRDWIHDDNTPLIEIAMSEAQWAQMISSMNTSGTPATIRWTKADGRIPDFPFTSRLELTADESKAAAEDVFAEAKEALATYKAHKTAENLRTLEAKINNAKANINFATKQLNEHAENVVTKARYDIEAMMDDKARQLGIDPVAATMLTEDQTVRELES